MTTDPRIEAAAIALYVSIKPDTRSPAQWPAVAPVWRHGYRRQAIAALAAADSSATITTFAALDALSEGSVVITKGRVYESAGDGDWYEPGDGGRWTTSSIHLPARVIHFGAQS